MDQAKEDNLERALRLRDNKRRHRQRKKEYVIDLERRLAQVHADGIQATKEVQAAARRVTWENSRLRQILHDQGLSDDAIDALIRGDGPPSPFMSDAAPQLKASTTQRAVHHEKVHREPKEEVGNHKAIHPYFPAAGQPQHPDIGTRVDTKSGECHRAVPPSEDTPAASDSPPRFTQQKACSQKTPTDVSPAPCKLLTILAANPHADITQLPPATSGEGKCREANGVECLRAREILMRYATSEQKLDDISHALERGCVKDRAGGGCYVKNDVIWRTLDRVCE